MCGIFGYLGNKDASEMLLEGLSRLEYRGYDSAGIAIITKDGQLSIRKASGKLKNLINEVDSSPLKGQFGLGHTRWATHGAPTQANAHPHTDCTGEIVVVHNGILENYVPLKEALSAKGHVFSSSTDSEIICHLIEDYISSGKSFDEAVRLAGCDLQGTHGIAAIYEKAPNTVVALRAGNAGGISIGYGNDEMYLASDLPALLPLTKSVVSLGSREMAIIQKSGSIYQDLDGHRLDRKPKILDATPDTGFKGGYPHFMLKEIMEQPESAMSTLRGRLSFDLQDITLDELPFTIDELRSIERVILVGMGTSNLAAEVGAHFIETLARIPAHAENSAEFRYRNPVLDSKVLLISVAQSGETADTLEAMAEGIDHKAKILTICNIEGSQATQIADGSMLIHAGLEIGVAATKTFTNSMISLYLLALHLGKARGAIDLGQIHSHVQNLTLLPGLMAKTLEMNQANLKDLAIKYSNSKRFLFIGRNLLEPVAREGALKLKEISYIHAEGLPAAELKHGPIALVEPETTVVAIAPKEILYQKMLSNISEVKARNGPVIAVISEGDRELVEMADDVIEIPATPELLTPIVSIIPLQLFAYHVAVHTEKDVDQPRNLAKTVTVE